MKSEWEFQFETRGFRFEREHKYKAVIDTPIRLGDRPPQVVEPLIRISPKEVEPPPYIDQVGSLYVLLPYSQSETKDFAFFVARTVADRISFQQGDFRIAGGLIICKRIAETSEEEAEFGDEIYFVQLNLVEVLPTPTFDSSALEQTPMTPQHFALIAQFNETKRDKSPIRQFLGYFRIIESISHASGKKGTMRQVLTQSEEFQRIFNTVAVSDTFDDLITKLVDMRHKCAHLKLQKGFGYTPIDPAIESDVKPLVSLMEIFAYESIMGGNSGDA